MIGSASMLLIDFSSEGCGFSPTPILFIPDASLPPSFVIIYVDPDKLATVLSLRRHEIVVGGVVRRPLRTPGRMVAVAAVRKPPVVGAVAGVVSGDAATASASGDRAAGHRRARVAAAGAAAVHPRQRVGARVGPVAVGRHRWRPVGRPPAVRRGAGGRVARSRSRRGALMV